MARILDRTDATAIPARAAVPNPTTVRFLTPLVSLVIPLPCRLMDQ
jgi:hypothetical protein